MERIIQYWAGGYPCSRLPKAAAGELPVLHSGGGDHYGRSNRSRNFAGHPGGAAVMETNVVLDHGSHNFGCRSSDRSSLHCFKKNEARGLAPGTAACVG